LETAWRIELFGRLRTVRGDREITRFRTQKTGALLAYLAYHRQRIHLREQLIELLWPECDLSAGRSNLSRELSALRHELESPVTSAGTIFVADHTSVRLNPEAVTIDVAEFEAALTMAARAGTSDGRAQSLARAVELYYGELLPGYHDAWVLQEREWLAERYFQALDQWLAILEGVGDWDRAFESAQRAVRIDPLREEVYRHLMRLLASKGKPAAALRQYRELQRVLREQLGAVPDPATRALADEIERPSILRRESSPISRIGSAVAHLPQRGPVATDDVQWEEGENRLVTLLCARVSRSDPSAPNRPRTVSSARLDDLLQVTAEIIAKYEGRLDCCFQEGALAVFGSPEAHEDDAERAIRAALEIRGAAHRLGLRLSASVDTGRGDFAGVGADPACASAPWSTTCPGWFPSVAGPVVDLASRLCEQARPGQILVSSATHRLTRRAFAFSPQPVAIHSGAHPSYAYAVGGGLPRPEKAYGIEGLRAGLIGRDEEMLRLQTALAELLRGRGQMVLLIGEAGVGKSRLVAELKAAASERLSVISPPSVGRLTALTAGNRRQAAYSRQLLWLEGRCLELGMSASYSVFVDMLRGYFAWCPEQSDRTRGDAIVASLRELVDRGALTAERSEEMGPLLGHLLSVRLGDDQDERLKNASPEQIRHQCFIAVQEFFLTVAQRQPLVLVFEDLHWADSLSLDLISLLAESLTHAALLLVCVYRPERDHKCWHLSSISSRKCGEHVTELLLRELTPAQSRRLVAALLNGETLSATLQDSIWERSRGNPFFVEEVVQSLIDTAQVYREGHAWRVREGTEAPTTPTSIQSLIQSRVDRLDPSLKHVLQSAAVIGHLFRRRLLECALEAGQHTAPGSLPGEVERALWELEERALVYQERVVPEEEYSFQHVLVQETIYRSLSPRRRAALHQQIAESMEALYREGLDPYYERLAYHYERSSADEKAVAFLLKAGEKARRAYLNEEAVGYFRRALERLDALPVDEGLQAWRVEALRGLGQTCEGLGDVSAAADSFRKAITVGRELGLAPRELVRLYYGLGGTLWWQNRYDEMLRLGEAGLALLGEETESVEAALMNYLTGMGHFWSPEGNPGRYREFADRNAQFLHRLHYSEELRRAYEQIVDVYAYDDETTDEALKWLQILERKAEEHHDLRALGGVHYSTGNILSARGDLWGSIPRREQALELYTRIGEAKHQSQCLFSMAETFLSLGDLESARTYGERRRETAERVGDKRDIAFSYTLMGMISLCEGALDKAKDAFENALQLYQDISFRVALESCCLGRVYLAQGERGLALRLFQEAVLLAKTETGRLHAALSGLEEAYEDPKAFQAFCHRFREEHPEVSDLPLAQWSLEPTQARDFSQHQVHDVFLTSPSLDWIWQNPTGDCSFTVGHGLVIHAVNGRDLWGMNLTAPRLHRSRWRKEDLPGPPGEAGREGFAVQTVCLPAAAELCPAGGLETIARPAIGGLLLWKDRENFVRLDRGLAGQHQVAFMGCLGDKWVILGRGRLPSERLFLRLERFGECVRALCSADGQCWFTVGQVVFPVEDPVEVGLYAIGTINRAIYPGAHPGGTAIRFESFQIWR
jgi:adenylate cyclase